MDPKNKPTEVKTETNEALKDPHAQEWKDKVTDLTSLLKDNLQRLSGGTYLSGGVRIEPKGVDFPKAISGMEDIQKQYESWSVTPKDASEKMQNIITELLVSESKMMSESWKNAEEQDKKSDPVQDPASMMDL